MPVLRSVVLIDAPLPSVAAALRELPMEVRLTRSVRFPLPRLGCRSGLTEAEGRTLLTETVGWPARRGAWGRALDVAVRHLARAALGRHAERVRARAEQLAAAPTVVAAAVFRDRRVLAQRRSRPAAVAGRWELPGGRVEPGESAHEALIRECREELAVEVLPGERLGPDVPLGNGSVLRAYAARLADPSAQPVCVEHDGLRWVGAAELAGLDWLDADRAILPDLEGSLRDP